ncbi:LysR family transcriptional regulator [Lutibaculum baratangense]|uniref:Transcriptional regulator, LysR family n=1 Tax=Lutibaculum baratangense AMV1 TaxID=631454 RepID=V4RHV9_9HYPH|nr:LysR family transcriptional regulator [Lutibaculum baratangense]ESR24894.1 Transcriptional regulator, LysR family [Lutibaculum baratangense AMV1]
MREASAKLSLRHLSAFMAVVDCGRISAAGDALRRSHSAIARSLEMLETRFGRPLLTRSRAGVAPTPAGLACDARCRIIENELASLRDLLERSGHAGLRGRQACLFRMQVDVSRLRALVSVHNLGSVQGAAHLLSVTQPAVSSSIRALETDLGVALFVRTPRGMIPTPAGASVAMASRRILSELRRIDDDIASLRGAPSGLVCIGGLAYSRNAVLPRAIKEVVGRFPQIVVRTVEGPLDSLLVAMHAGEVDVIICARPEAVMLEGVKVETLLRDRMKLFVSRDHPLAGRKAVPAGEVLDYPFILPPVGTVTRALLVSTFRAVAGRDPEGAVETSSYTIIRKLVMESRQICFRSVSEFSPEGEDVSIVPLDLAFDLPAREICLLQRKGAILTAAAADALAVLRDVARGH